MVLNASWYLSYFGGIADPDCESKPPSFGAALVVGAGVEGNTPYWIVKNSLGTVWGEGGYFRIVRGQNKCGIADYAMVPVE